MNERTRELAEQALQLVADKHTNGDESRLNTDSYHVKDLIQAKFAELIVAECLEELRYTVLDTQELRRDKSTDYQVGWEDGMFDAGEMIKQHFGVEE